MREYLQTPAQLAAKGKLLGDFAPGTTYSGFMDKARASGVPNPTLGLAITFKPGMHFLEETAYPITVDEWAQFLADVPAYCTATPKVYVVDGGLYTMPI